MIQAMFIGARNRLAEKNRRRMRSHDLRARRHNADLERQKMVPVIGQSLARLEKPREQLSSLTITTGTRKSVNLQALDRLANVRRVDMNKRENGTRPLRRLPTVGPVHRTPLRNA